MGKKIAKTLLRSPPAQVVVSLLMATYALCVRATGRLTESHPAATNGSWGQGSPAIVAIWHGRLMLMPWLFRRCPHTVYALISAHRDGRLVSFAARWYGIKTVQGSSTRGGAAALKTMLRLAKGGQTLFITPDGPKGPRMQVQDGALELARLTGLPILPVSIGASRAKLARSWDRFLIPLPFGRLHIAWGDPLHVPRTATDLTPYRDRLTAALTDCQRTADAATIGEARP
jgi:lysophospholipid acyltransferase (LPLAT)-like uncharacterized protein